MYDEAVLEKLASTELFRGLSTEDIQILLSHASSLTVPAGQAVFESGTEDRALYFLLEGSIEIQLDVPFAPQQVLAELQPVSVFGESSFFHPDVHSATACATSESTVIKLGRIAYQGLLDTHNISALRLAANAAEILAAKLQHTDAWIAQLVTNEQMHRIQQKWWDFRQSLGHSFSRPAGGGFSVGAGLRDD